MMAEDEFCDFQTEMDHTLMSQLPNFNSRHNQGTDNYDNAATKQGPGFYMDQYAAANMHGVAVPNIMISTNSIPSTTSNSATTAAAGLYEPNTNYAMKSERGLPPTPPGSPPEEDSKDDCMSSARQQSAMAMASQYMLAKPVPMRRISDKRNIARPSLPTMATMPVESMLTESMLGQAAAAAAASGTSPTLARALAAVQQTQKRPRSEKKPIPGEMKDDKYFERRKRNNNAAKKSRDARKAREDEIAIRASFLEKENAILRAQVATLREEANSLKELLLQKRGRP